jgi:hypothetical protein
VTELREVSVVDAGITGLRIVAHFPVDFPHVSVQDVWPQPQIQELMAGGWAVPQTRADLALQSYGHDVLDGLIRSMPTSVLELSGGPEVLRASGLAPEDLDVLLQPAADWSLVQARISLWNLGIGLVTLVYDLSTDVVPNGFGDRPVDSWSGLRADPGRVPADRFPDGLAGHLCGRPLG